MLSSSSGLKLWHCRKICRFPNDFSQKLQSIASLYVWLFTVIDCTKRRRDNVVRMPCTHAEIESSKNQSGVECERGLELELDLELEIELAITVELVHLACAWVWDNYYQTEVGSQTQFNLPDLVIRTRHPGLHSILTRRSVCIWTL